MMTAPSGRIRNPAPKVANDSSKDVSALPPGKNSLPMVTAKKLYSVKSYISSPLPIAAATMARRVGARRTGSAEFNVWLMADTPSFSAWGISFIDVLLSERSDSGVRHRKPVFVAKIHATSDGFSIH